MKTSLGAGEWIRRGLGAAVLVGVAAIALGLDTGFLTRISAATTAALEQELLDRTGAAISGAGDRVPSAVEMTDAARRDDGAQAGASRPAGRGRAAAAGGRGRNG